MSDLSFRPPAIGKVFSALPVRAVSRRKPRLLVLIVAYNAEKTIGSVLSRVPRSIADEYDVEVLVIDDASGDRTFERGHEVVRDGSLSFPLTVLFNPVNQGYGGNQKIGYFYAIKHGFDFVALVHGDGQYAPECLPELLLPLKEGKAEASFGSRMMRPGAARKGGMPLYKYVGNRILTALENRILGTSLSEFHSGYRIYSVNALKRIPFAQNTNDFHFDTEIIVQLALTGQRIVEQPIPTYYGDEICHVNGIRYAWNVMKAVLKARAQSLGLLYDRRFDISRSAHSTPRYRLKAEYDSSHSYALDVIPEHTRVLDLGCAGGYVGELLRDKRGSHVVGVDILPLPGGVKLDDFRQHDLNAGLPDISCDAFDCILLLDLIDQLSSPEDFLVRLQEAIGAKPETKLVVSTGNVGFFVTRLMLLLGQFNYGKRGILDMTHTRLFTFTSLRRLLEQSGFRIVEMRGVPGPFPLAMNDTRLSRMLLRMNKTLIRLSRGLFSYQVFVVAQPVPSLDYLLREAQRQSALRAAAG